MWLRSSKPGEIKARFERALHYNRGKMDDSKTDIEVMAVLNAHNVPGPSSTPNVSSLRRNFRSPHWDRSGVVMMAFVNRCAALQYGQSRAVSGRLLDISIIVSYTVAGPSVKRSIHWINQHQVPYAYILKSRIYWGSFACMHLVNSGIFYEAVSHKPCRRSCRRVLVTKHNLTSCDTGSEDLSLYSYNLNEL